jgi:hypothetical protein
MRNLDEILYVNIHYSRKPWGGLAFIGLFLLIYLAMTFAGCAWLWFAR